MMTVEIKSFSEAILFHMQREKQGTLNFGEIWRLCARSEFGTRFEPDRFAKPFVAAIRRSLDDLEGRSLITVITKDSGEKVRHIALTRLGQDLLGETVFSHQQRMGVSD